MILTKVVIEIMPYFTNKWEHEIRIIVESKTPYRSFTKTEILPEDHLKSQFDLIFEKMKKEFLRALGGETP